MWSCRRPEGPAESTMFSCELDPPGTHYSASIHAENRDHGIRVGFCLFLPYQRIEPLPSSTVPSFSLSAKTSSEIDVPAFVRSMLLTEAFTVCFLGRFFVAIKRILASFREQGRGSCVPQSYAASGEWRRAKADGSIHRSSGRRPVSFAILASAAGPTSSLSWKQNVKFAHPAR